MWPDNHVQTVQLEGNPCVVKRETGEEAWVYSRGPAYDAILAVIDEELQRQEDEVQDVLAELQEESDQRIAGIMAGEDVTVVSIDPEPMSLLCDYDGPHYDCESCPDPETGEAPKHHETAAALGGHKRSNLHKRHNVADEESEAG
jgi:hypothetical protein|tara:strand:+ start:1386 stop:1820 length:435 start_codon:yes stop_codon:yes gene_type:complete